MAASAKQLCSFLAVDEYLPKVKSSVGNRKVLFGLGSGSTVVYVAKRLEQKFKDDVICVPTSFQALQLIDSCGLTRGDLNQYPELDLTIDGADEVDAQLNAIKGGGGCLAQEKVVASSSKVFVIVADSTKKSDLLCQKWKAGIPVEVLPMAYVSVTKQIERFAGVQKVDLRLAVKKAGPVVTDNGNFIVDVLCDPLTHDSVADFNRRLRSIPGVVETGLFVGMAEKAFFGFEDGTIETLSAPGFQVTKIANQTL